MPSVNAEILRWARERAGLSLGEAAHKLGMKGRNAVQRLTQLEAGDDEPSRSVLVRMAEKYRRPLLTFYLPAPPNESNKGQDFRSLNQDRIPDVEAKLDILLRDVHARQGLIKSALEEAEEDTMRPFVGTATINDNVNALVNQMRETLGVSVEGFREQSTAENAFKYLRSGAENAGIFVLLIGNLGSHHTKISVENFRGFALADLVAPFVVINENDSRAAWSFTLLHELCHIWLGQTGISGYNSDVAVERFCNAVAARFLLDPNELADFQAHPTGELADLKNRIDSFANSRNLSRKMVAYNLLRSGIISAASYESLVAIYDEERAALQAQQDGAPSYYVVRKHRIGSALIDTVRRMMAAGALSTTRAGKVLGVKATNVARVVESNRAA